jgi:N-acetylglucosamine-6-sulfatase
MVFKSLSLYLFITISFAYSSTSSSLQPNIILLLLDDQDSLLGSGLDVMPNYFQHFISEGLIMKNAFVASPKCCPSRTSMLSGRFSHRLQDTTLGWCGDFNSANRWNETFMKDVKAQGYTMGFFGKLINSMGPLCPKNGKGIIPAGFIPNEGDLFVAMCNEAYYNVTYNVNGELVTTFSSPSDYHTSWIGNKTIPWLAKAAKDASNGGKPFFAHLSPHAPHLPATPAPWYIDTPLPTSFAPRLPSFNNYTSGKSWNIIQNGLTPFKPDTIIGIDLHFQNRQRSLLSIDDFVRDIFETLESAGGQALLENTFFIVTSDHGYHLGEFGLIFEKSTPYETDIRVPFFVRGPGVPKNASVEGMISLIDIGPTILELSGARLPGTRTQDGRSFVPLLKGGSLPTEWRNGLLIEHLGEVNQWMNICSTIWNASCPDISKDPFYLIDGPQNTWAMWRVKNSTHDFAYTEFRPQGTDPARVNTNWTELYDLRLDPFQEINLASSVNLEQYSNELWEIANCTISTCP